MQDQQQTSFCIKWFSIQFLYFLIPVLHEQTSSQVRFGIIPSRIVCTIWFLSSQELIAVLFDHEQRCKQYLQCRFLQRNWCTFLFCTNFMIFARSKPLLVIAYKNSSQARNNIIVSFIGTTLESCPINITKHTVELSLDFIVQLKIQQRIITIVIIIEITDFITTPITIPITAIIIIAIMLVAGNTTSIEPRGQQQIGLNFITVIVIIIIINPIRLQILAID